MHRHKLLALLLLLVSLTLPMFALAGDNGYVGFGTETTISGFLSPKLKRVKVTEVQAGSPAEKSGMRVGDHIVEANGKPIAGAPAREMAKSLREVAPGQRLALKIKRADGTLADITIVAGTKPN